MDLFEVIDDRVVGVPNQTGLFSDPLRVSCRRNAVIRVVEGPASLPVGAEDLGAAAILLALGTFLCNKGTFRFTPRYSIRAKAAPAKLVDYYNPDLNAVIAPQLFVVSSLPDHSGH